MTTLYLQLTFPVILKNRRLFWFQRNFSATLQNFNTIYVMHASVARALNYIIRVKIKRVLVILLKQYASKASLLLFLCVGTTCVCVLV